MTAPITIITACYNQGQYLDACCSSVRDAPQHDQFEHIIINDGSTDPLTILKLQEWKAKGIRVIDQENKGLGAARNRGVELAAGTYILPLDSDNKIEPGVFIQALEIMEEDPGIDVVYTDSCYFGAVQARIRIGLFDISKLLYNNYIDACALIRKVSLIESGGFEEMMPAMGNEDWALWVRMAMSGRKFFYLPEPGFHYRVKNHSMVSDISYKSQAENRRFIFIKNAAAIADHYARFYEKEYATKDMEHFVKRNNWKTLVNLLVHKILRKLKTKTRFS